MPRRKFDKSTSTTFALLNRPQNDPKIHDASSSSMVFQELAPSQAHKIKSRRDLEADLADADNNTGGFPEIRDNEGEAAEYGIYYDDTDYDYMQHMRDLGSGTGDGKSYFVEAPVKKQAKGKAKLRLEDALKEASLEDNTNKSSVSGDGKPQPLLGEDVLPSKSLKQSSYQDQQDVPDALAGFQPDMDPRLREVLEALEDEAYIDDEDDIFGEIARDRKEVSLAEFEELGFVDDQDVMDDDGWETDGTEKPPKEFNSVSLMPPEPNTEDVTMADGPDHGDGDWMKEFSKFKKDQKAQAVRPQASKADLDLSTMNDSSMTGGRRKKRKGAMTSSTAYSMTSSSLLRTEGQTLLDARFDKIEEDYAEDAMDDDGGVSIVSGLTGASLASSQAPSLAARSDFDGMMDDFLGSYSMSGKKRLKRGGPQTGMDQLDEIRKGLGPARLKSQKA